MVMSEQKTEQSKHVFDVERLYVKSSTFESFSLPKIFREEWQPEITIEIKANNTKLDEEYYEVILVGNIKAQIYKSKETEKDKQDLYSIKVEQAGIFKIKGFDEEQNKQILAAYCPNILYPYLRKIISDIAINASLPPVVLAPINFEFLYQQNAQPTEAAKK